MIKTDIYLPLGYTDADVVSAIKQRLPLSDAETANPRILKRSLDLTGERPLYKTTVALSLSEERERGLLLMRKKVSETPSLDFIPPSSQLKSRPVVVGAGPAGLFCALTLAIAGARPIVIERGLPVDERAKSVGLFISSGYLNTESNVQFGEGGAGTYSDGKLKVGAMDKYKNFILEKFVCHGAPSDILYSTTAHVGTDKLREVVKGLSQEIVSLGGEIHFSSRLSSLKVKNGKIAGGRVDKNGEITDFDSDTVILATGHSARDSFELLLSAGAALTPRGFGIGLRVEHQRELIDSLVYGRHKSAIPDAASYHLVTHLEGGRSAYSFCMCPGGSVVPAASEEGGIVTNGMSEYKRDADNSNSALLVSVDPSDFPSSHPLAGLDLQRSIERAAYSLTSSYAAPAVRMEDFMSGRESACFGSVRPSYPIGVSTDSPERILPSYVSESLKLAIRDFDDWMPGFYFADATLTAPETRTTSPVRVLRTESFEAVGITGLYPIGEGAGYSGGIVSSARDGVMAAESILLSRHCR